MGTKTQFFPKFNDSGIMLCAGLWTHGIQFSVTFSPVVKCSQNQVSANAFAKPEAGFKNDRAGE
ncbi:hypothetical protein, partial [Klebsiella pneumoniae]|uniref:hypothetical protein n=1 Tax=Klebsiella pneumoniae TaxID=573 RepID=UPI001C6F9AF9